MRMRRQLVVLGAALAVVAAAIAPVWLSPSASAPSERLPTEMPPQLAGVQWDECMIENEVPEEVSGFFVDRQNGHVAIQVQDSEGDYWTPDQVVANAGVRGFVVRLGECLTRYPLARDHGPAQLDLAERALYYDYLASALVPCLDRHGVSISVPDRPSMRYLDLTTWYLQAIDLAEIGLDEALRIWDECPLLPSYLDGE
jgi:hypothetical protein